MATALKHPNSKKKVPVDVRQVGNSKQNKPPKKKSSASLAGYELPAHATKRLTKAFMLKCIVGSGGIIMRIARHADTSYMQAYCWIRNHEKIDPDVKEAMEYEMNLMGDVAEVTILDAMLQRKDLSTASRTAQWYLGLKAKARGYQAKQTFVHEGGDKPIELQSTQQVALDELDLDLVTKKTVLKALRDKRVNGQ